MHFRKTASLLLAALMLAISISITGCAKDNDHEGGGEDAASDLSTVKPADGESEQGGDGETEAGPGTEQEHPGERLPSLEDIMAGDAVWTYTDDPVRLSSISGAEWTAPGFDDSGWLCGSGSFGAEDGKLDELSGDYMPDVCLRQYLPDGSAIPVYFFRLRFNVPKVEETLPVTVGIRYDDSVIVYLNGDAVFSGNVPECGFGESGGYGSDEACGAPRYDSFTFETSDLTEGENVLSVELHQDNGKSSDIYFGLESVGYGSGEGVALRNNTLFLGVGSDESEMLVSWQGDVGAKDARVNVEKDTGEGFSEGALTFPAEACYPDEDGGTCTYRARLTGLEPGDYIYRAEDVYPTVTRRFTVAEKSGAFSFLCAGDPQINDEDDRGPMKVFEDLADYVSGGAHMSFLLSLGDQSNSSSRSGPYRQFLSAGFFKTTPTAPIIGNHEKNSKRFSHFFYMPNMDDNSVIDAGDMSGDYWFVRGNTLFLCLDSNNKDMEEHEAFLRAARRSCIEQYGEPVWTVAAFHHAIFSKGDHAEDVTIIERRGQYPALLEDAGVDIVFCGHDHAYTRSYPMKLDVPVKGGSSEDGIIYLTLSSSTGTKFYELSDTEADYADVTFEEHVPCMTRVDIADGSMTITTYCARDGGYEVVDTLTLKK